MFPMVIFAGLAFCFVGILQCLGHFRLPSVISLFSNGAIVLYLLFLEDSFGVYGLSFALLIGWMLQAAVQLPTAVKLGFSWRPSFRFLTPEVRKAASAFIPVLVATWLVPIVNLINTRAASGIADGRAVTAIGYANRFYIIIVGVFSFIATNLLFPKLSRASAGGDEAGAKKLTASSLKILLAVVFPVAAGCFVLALPIIKLIFVNGDFTVSDAKMTAEALRWFCLGMPAMAINEVLQKLFFSRRELKAPMLTSVASSAIDVVLVYYLSNAFGIAGIAGASGIVITLCAVANYFIDARHGGGLFCAKDLLDMVKIAVFALLTGVVAYLVFDLTVGIMPEYAALLLAVVSGVAVYAVLSFILPIDELAYIFGRKKSDNNEKSEN